jgi:uncharacterized protein with ParB-like and HNH nuclease domain
MATGILPPELKSIAQFFTGDARYIVPKYQRSFAWGPDEIEELWEDISSAVERGGDYFIGTIVLHKKQSGPQEIIDGQQRLTCISMIFSAVRNVFLSARDDRAQQLFISFLGAKDFSRDAPVNSKLVLNEVNKETYMQYVLESKNLEEIDNALKSKSLHESNRMLLKAYHYYLSKISSEVASKGTDLDDFIVPLIDCLRNSVKSITIPVTSEEDANLFFESLNARGKELAVSDLVKNRLYLEAGNQVIRAQQLWEQMEIHLARRPIPEYLRHYWIAKKIDAKGFNVREKQLYQMISQDVQGKQAATLKLLTDLASSAEDYARISDYNLWPDEDAYDMNFEETLNALRLFRVTQCNPILLNAIQHFISSRDIAYVFRIVSNFSYRYFIIGNQSPGNLERISNGIAAGVRTGEYSTPKDVADAFRAINPDANFRADFELAVLSKTRVKIARYTLSQLTNSMSKQSSRVGCEQIANPNAKQVTLEHVLPQNPKPTWKAAFSKDVDPDEYIYRIGNLTLLTAKVNRDASNASFTDKQKNALNDSNLAINQQFKDIKKWGVQEIEQRQTQLAKVALDVWRL